MLIEFLTLSALAGGISCNYHDIAPDTNIFGQSTQIVYLNQNSLTTYNAYKNNSSETFIYKGITSSQSTIDDNLTHRYIFDLSPTYASQVDSTRSLLSASWAYDHSGHLYFSFYQGSIGANFINLSIDVTFELVKTDIGTPFYVVPFHVDYLSYVTDYNYQYDFPFDTFTLHPDDFRIYTFIELHVVDTTSIKNNLSDGGYQLGYQDGYNVGSADSSSNYNAGYGAGYSAGVSESQTVSFEDGYNQGYSVGSVEGYGLGYQDGEHFGYDAGFYDGSNSEQTILSLAGAIIDTPILFLRKLFGYELFGISIFGVLTTLISVIVMFSVFKLVRSYFW